MGGKEEEEEKEGKKIKPSSEPRHPAILLSKSGRSFAQLWKLGAGRNLKTRGGSRSSASRLNGRDAARSVLMTECVEVSTPGCPLISPTTTPPCPLLKHESLHLNLPTLGDLLFSLLFMAPLLTLAISDAARLEMSGGRAGAGVGCSPSPPACFPI